MSLRAVTRTRPAAEVREGAGFKVNRAFGNGDTSATDPFLLLDHFQSDDPNDYMAGAPWHPHRGIETISYIVDGAVEHQDSLGNRGVIRSGGVQWMTAGSGIIHQEMPQGTSDGRMHGFQLWANLPAAQKMTAPRYQDVDATEIAEVTEDDGTVARIITGEFWGQRGPVEGIAANPRYLDLSVPPDVTRSIRIELESQAFAYVFSGDGLFHGASQPIAAQTEYVRNGVVESPVPGSMADDGNAQNRTLVLFDRGDEIRVTAGPAGIRFLLVSGRPLGEPVAWYGPIVMNTRDELITAFEEYQQGTFLKS